MILYNRRKRITIKDLAQKAGVTTQTSSRVMNRFSYVSEGTRQRVEALVKQSAVINFDNISKPPYFHPSLTTVSQLITPNLIVHENSRLV